MAISFITAKTFPQKLTVTSETISEIINSPLTAIDNSPLLKDNQDILDIIVEYEPATLAVERLSILVPPLKRMPSLEAAPIPEKKESGMDITIAHGQLITRNVRAV